MIRRILLITNILVILVFLSMLTNLNAEEKYLTQAGIHHCAGSDYTLDVEAVYYLPKNELQVTVSNNRLVNTRDLELKDFYIYVYDGPILIGEEKKGNVKLKINESKTYNVKLQSNYHFEYVTVVVKGYFESVAGLGPVHIERENAMACGQDLAIIMN